MAKALQIRDVPEDVHATLRARAAEARMTVSAYVLKELTEIARRPTNAEIVERLARRSRREGPTTEEIVTLIREARGE